MILFCCGKGIISPVFIVTKRDTPKSIPQLRLLLLKICLVTFLHKIEIKYLPDAFTPSNDLFQKMIEANGVKNDMSHERGVISMARNSYDMNSASSQFFIMIEDNASLDGSYAAFGRVFAGLDVIDKIASVEVKGETPVNPPIE